MDALHEMMARRIWRGCFVIVLLSVCVLGACSAYVRMGTTVIADSVSPDGKWDAVLLVRNGGAMTGYSTAISITRANWVARQSALFALYRPVHVFVADDNDGQVVSGSQGQIDVKVRWASTTELVVACPAMARVARADSKFQSVNIRYVPST
jgi:hypothetical protein